MSDDSTSAAPKAKRSRARSLRIGSASRRWRPDANAAYLFAMTARARPFFTLPLIALSLLGCRDDRPRASEVSSDAPRVVAQAVDAAVIVDAAPRMTPVTGLADLSTIAPAPRSDAATTVEPTTEVDADTARILDGALAATRRGALHDACELIGRASRHAPDNALVRRVAGTVARAVEARNLGRTGPEYYQLVQFCWRNRVPINPEIFT